MPIEPLADATDGGSRVRHEDDFCLTQMEMVRNIVGVVGPY